LTVRPHRTRRKPYTRVVVCESAPVPAASRVFAAPRDAPADAYARTIVLAPAGLRAAFASLAGVADVVYAGDADARQLDLEAALRALREAGVATVVCEGGPTLAARLLARRLVARAIWFVAPVFLQSPESVPVLAGADLATTANGWTFEGVVRAGDDLMLTARLPHV
jgi:riboflavin biosynthesis pyrimidine reductase